MRITDRIGFDGLRRVSAVAAIVATVAVGTVFATGASGADTVAPVRGGSAAADFSREVSGFKLVDGRIANGEVITVTNRVNRKLAWLIYHVRDTHPTCMDPVPKTSVWTVSGKTYTNNPNRGGEQRPGEVTSGPGWTQIKPPGANSWESVTWSQDYLLKCDIGTLNTGGLTYSTTWAGDDGEHPYVGPKLVVTPGVAGISVAPREVLVNNDVTVTVKNPDGRPGDRVTLTADGKPVVGCGNLQLEETRMVSCTWAPSKAGSVRLSAVIASSEPKTVATTVQVDAVPGGSLGGLGAGSLDAGSLGGFLG